MGPDDLECPDFKVTTFFDVEYLKNGSFFRDKVTIEH